PPRVPVAKTEPPSSAAPQPDLSPIRRTETPREQPPLGDVTQSETQSEELAELTPDAPAPETPPPAQQPSESRPAPSPAPQPHAEQAPVPPGHVPPDLEADLEVEDAGSWSTTTAQAVVPPPMVRGSPPRDAPD